MSAHNRRFYSVHMVCTKCGVEFEHVTSQPAKSEKLLKQCEYCRSRAHLKRQNGYNRRKRTI
jgi:DNA-directed RNA polymerase subunit RPC12/RpoP